MSGYPCHLLSLTRLTRRFHSGTAIYDTSEKKRVPSWCDRILYRSEAKDTIKALSYRRYEADISDHRVESLRCSLLPEPC